VVLAALVAVVLAGCATPGSDATASPSPDETAPIQASETSGGPVSTLPDDLVFRITATATGPTGVVDLVESVGLPRPVTAPEEPALDAAGCDDWRTLSAPSVQDVQFTTTLASGTWDRGWIVADAGLRSAFSGAFFPFQANCSSAALEVPGSATALHVFVGDDPDLAGGWATERFGFFIVPGDDPDAAPGPNVPHITACRIELGPNAAVASTLVAAWPSTTQNPDGLSCAFGG
jgi:hypothetical protein